MKHAAVSVPAMAFLVALAAFAEDPQPQSGNLQTETVGPTPVAQLKSLQGNVLISGAEGLVSADLTTRLTQTSRLLSTSNATALLEYDDGCQVKISADQRAEIRIDIPCDERAATASSVYSKPEAQVASGGATPGAAASAALTGAVGTGIAAGVAGAALASTIAIKRRDRNTSPN